MAPPISPPMSVPMPRMIEPIAAPASAPAPAPMAALSQFAPLPDHGANDRDLHNAARRGWCLADALRGAAGYVCPATGRTCHDNGPPSRAFRLRRLRHLR